MNREEGTTFVVADWYFSGSKSGMEPDEIGVVLARASELHAKISDAIERALKSEFLLSTGVGRSQKNGESATAEIPPSSPTSASDQGGYGGKESTLQRRPSESDGVERGDGSAEARSLGSIRDALEVLEEQLESLQTVQQQQRTEKDAALAELEESRRILLRLLKDHRGKEWEVVHEALAFAGEPVEDRDDLPLPPYPMPLSDTSFGPVRDDQKTPYNGPATEKYNGSMKQFSFDPGHAEGAANEFHRGEADGSEEEGDVEEGTSFQAERGRRNGGGVLGIPVSFAKAIFGFAYGVTSKVAIVAVTVAAALAVSEATRRLEVKETCSKFLHKRAPAPPPIATARQLPPQRECPPGKKLIMEDGYPKCVVKERVELPFYREVKTPDVLYGRG